MSLRSYLQIFLCIFFAALAACDLQNSTHELLSESQMTSLQVDSGWSKTTGLNENADLQAINRKKNLYAVIISEEKKNFEGLSLEQYSALTRAPMMGKLKDAVTTEPSRFQINNLEAIQYRVSGTFEKQNLVHFHVAVSGKTHFHQIIVWSTQSDFHRNESELQEIVRSFRERAK